MIELCILKDRWKVSFSTFWLAVVEVGDNENDSSFGGWFVELHRGGLIVRISTHISRSIGYYYVRAYRSLDSGPSILLQHSTFIKKDSNIRIPHFSTLALSKEPPCHDFQDTL